MTRLVLLWGAITVIAPAFLPAAALAQETTRAAEIAAAQAEKARNVVPYEPSKAERIADDVQDRLLETPQGFYPWFDSVYSGGGFTGGAGYRHFIGDRTFIDTRGLLSGKGYKLAEVAIDGIGDNGVPPISAMIAPRSDPTTSVRIVSDSGVSEKVRFSPSA